MKQKRYAYRPTIALWVDIIESIANKKLKGDNKESVLQSLENIASYISYLQEQLASLGVEVNSEEYFVALFSNNPAPPITYKSTKEEG